MGNNKKLKSKKLQKAKKEYRNTENLFKMCLKVCCE